MAHLEDVLMPRLVHCHISKTEAMVTVPLATASSLIVLLLKFWSFTSEQDVVQVTMHPNSNSRVIKIEFHAADIHFFKAKGAMRN